MKLKKLHEMGKEVVREELKIIPAQAVIVQHVRYTYSCRNCEKTGTEVPVIKAPVKNTAIKGGFASPEAVAYIMTQKYLMDIPLYRQENDFKRKDILLSRQTMANWIMKCSEMWLKPVYDVLHNKLFKIEEKISELSPEEKYIKRQELSKPVLDDFFSWLNSFTPASQSHLGKAVAYTLNQWKNLQNYLLDGRLNICNNLAEHLAKSFALCRKNFLFSNTPRGAEASATV